MVSLTARLLLMRAANQYVSGRKSFCKEEIAKRINEIKYLSAQKKVPKLTLRKEIIHLERQLKDIFELEKRLLDQEQKESAKVSWLKQEITQLKKRIAVSDDANLQKKVDHLSHLLGETLAKKAVMEEIASHQALHQAPAKTQLTPIIKPAAEHKTELSQELLDRLQALKKEVISKEQTNPILAQKLLEKLNSIEERLTAKLPSSALVTKEQAPKHTFIFNGPKPKPVEIDEAELERELPLPPPPRMTE